MADDHDVCECGDWRYQHKDGVGRCAFGSHGIPDKRYDTCAMFRLFTEAALGLPAQGEQG